MDKVAMLSAAQRAELFSETAARKGVGPAIIEKDFWVCWVLCRIFQAERLTGKLLFKGGTSLSKVFNLIERFSEDIDLILNWEEITQEDPLKRRSRKQQKKFNEQFLHKGHLYIHDTLLPELEGLLGDICQVQSADESLAVINVRYPASFAEDYLRPEIRLEIGPRALWCPFTHHTITSYAAEAFPQLFETPACSVSVVTAERTFWEKATILHAEANRPLDGSLPLRYSRHYYDMARMAQSSIKDSALENLDLLESVVHFKETFFRSGWTHYDLAKPGTFRLVPEKSRLTELNNDYRQMQIMIFGRIPDFSEIMDVLSKLEREINQQ